MEAASANAGKPPFLPICGTCDGDGMLTHVIERGKRLLLGLGAVCFLTACTSETLVGPFDRPDTIRRVFRDMVSNGLPEGPALVLHSSGRSSRGIMSAAATNLQGQWSGSILIAGESVDSIAPPSPLDTILRQLPTDIVFGINANREIAALDRSVLDADSVATFGRMLDDETPLTVQREATVAMLRARIEAGCVLDAANTKPSRIAFFLDVCHTCYSGQELQRAVAYAQTFSRDTCIAVPHDYYTLIPRLRESRSIRVYGYDQTEPDLVDILFRYHLLVGHAPLIWSGS